MIKVNEKQVNFKHFNDGTLRLTYEPDSLLGDCYITWLFDSEEEIAQLYFLVNHLRENYRISNIILWLPYVPEARMDRIHNRDECFTLKYFCQFINNLNFKRVEIFDPHSSVAAALLGRVEVHNPSAEIGSILHNLPSALLAFVDEGGYKRYKNIIDSNYFIFGVKDRDWLTQTVNSMQILGAKHMIAGRDILIVDDIISRGSSVYLLAKQLKEMGCANIYAWISHCENTILQPHINGQSLLEIPNLITKIYTTDSICRIEHPKIEIIKRF